MKQAYRPSTPRLRSSLLLSAAAEALRTFLESGVTVTSRQVAYHLMNRGLLPHTAMSFERVGETLRDGRMAGLIPWGASHPDGTTQLRTATTPAEIRVDRWADQPHYVELVVSRRGLGGVLAPVSSEFRVPLTESGAGECDDEHLRAIGERLQAAFRRRMAHAGHMPATFAGRCTPEYVASYISDYLAEALEADDVDENGVPLLRWESHEAQRRHLPRMVVYFLTDADPATAARKRRLHQRLALFAGGIPLEVQTLSVTPAQVNTYGLLPNPQTHAWEMECVPPSTLAMIVRSAVTILLDDTLWRSSALREDALRDQFLSQFRRISPDSPGFTV